MRLRELLVAVKVTDNIEIVEKDANGEPQVVFSILRNFERVTEDKIPEEYLEKTVTRLCGAGQKYKLVIHVE